ncbi:acetyl/propionyl/methylcrotonyl-CoA carboxylase subunit alpha [Leekyejoonella antrihumi]|uniref:biotin carboxylase n=1 Tax=Leekyejoonella antrihumi TaxID=1660198 RepID=A0A563DWG8_9MICO|nr:biotin carboxylase N-terminal domain-containing protein [Leekyejoonella antrihumi]TWP34469.1 biotin/lipoyl-binding protein [Leekyejoonella antrihumi]
MRKVLIANRGEIAVRVIRACADAGLSSVAVFADPDAGALHTRMADEEYALGGSTAVQSYLSIDKLLAVARRSGADAVHPGYGFLSESAEFAEAVVAAGLTWIGPTPEAIRNLGNKVTARQFARRVGAPLVPGTTAAVSGPAEVIEFAKLHGLPIAIKAVFGGGGRGLKVAWQTHEIPELLASATREAVAAFGNGDCFVERYLDRPRHVEAQILADTHGAVVVVGTRDCSLQRRHQKLVEEAPAPYLSAVQEHTIRTSAKDICAAGGYVSAGTVEYLVGMDGTISFLEVNTRLQVEHPISEETTGIDLVREQFRIAAGEHLTLRTDPTPRGHSIEFRINGEDAGRNFLPEPGRVTRLVLPNGPGIRVDSGIQEGSVLSGQFDSLLAKLIVTGANRQEALQRARRALAETTIEGLATVLPFHRAVVRQPAFVGDQHGFAVHTRWIETDFNNTIEPFTPTGAGGSPQPGGVTIEIGGRPMEVSLPGLDTLGEAGSALRAQALESSISDGAPAVHGDVVVASMQGTITQLTVEEDQRVEAGELIAVLEAMKMENRVTAHKTGTVTGLTVRVGSVVMQGRALCEIKD